MNATYTRYEMLRLVRNKRSFIFSLIFPLALFLVIGGSNKDARSTAARDDQLHHLLHGQHGQLRGDDRGDLAAGRASPPNASVGWTRQLRITPLPVRTYFRTKVLTAYVMAFVSIALLYVAGLAYGVRLDSIGRWVGMTGAAAGRHAAVRRPRDRRRSPADHRLDGPGARRRHGVLRLPRRAVVPAPRPRRAARHRRVLPSYWLTQASHFGVGAPAWGVKGWTVVGVWSVAMTPFAAWAYRRDTDRA